MNRKSLIFFAFSFLLATKSISQIPPGYYNSAIGLTGLPLKTALHNIIKNHTVVSYSSLLTYFQTTDDKPNGKVWDMYSDVPGGTPPYEYSFGSNCGNYNSEGDCYNREHSFPQSWFNSASPMVSDLFHIYPTDGYVNGERSNYPYGEVATPTWTSLNGSKLGPCSYTGYAGTVFEPIDEYKGDFARSFLYMAVRYYTEDASWPGSAMVNGAEPYPWAIVLLKNWSAIDTVSQKEIDRNNTIYGIQNNRNPFIDHPEYATAIWGPTSVSIAELHNNETMTVTNNPGNGIYTISISSSKTNALKIYSSMGQLIYSENSNSTKNTLSTTIDITTYPAGVYYLQLTTDKKIISEKIIKL